MINISVKNPATFVTITVTKLTGKPASVIHNITGKVYKYIDITSTNLPDNNIDKAKIQFQVNKSWIVSNKIDRTKITLNRYKNNNWERLPTLEISEDNDYVYYEAETSGFSTFAITGEEKVITTTITATTSLPTKITTTTISEKKITGVRSYVIIVFATTILVSVAMIVFIKKYVGIERRKKTPEAFSATPSLIFKFPNQYVGKRVALSGNIEFIKKVEKTGNFWHFIKDENSKIYVLSDKMIQPGPIKIIGIIEESKGHIFIRAGKVEID
jgi:PGF-pre-PGF domain-containing protein